MRGRPWSKDEENQLQQLVKDGKGFDEISSIMNASGGSLGMTQLGGSGRWRLSGQKTKMFGCPRA
jgi:hypothetical protein